MLDFVKIINKTTSLINIKHKNRVFYLKGSEIDDITISDNNLGKILGYSCADQTNFGDHTISRILIIYKLTNRGDEFSITSEYCEASKVDFDKLKKECEKKNAIFNKILEPYNLKSELIITKEDSVYVRYNKLNNEDTSYIKSNIDDYIHDLENFYISNTKSLKESETYKNLKKLKNLPLVKEVYKQSVINNQFDILYKGNNIDKVAEKLKIVDNKLWDEYYNIVNNKQKKSSSSKKKSSSSKKKSSSSKKKN